MGLIHWWPLNGNLNDYGLKPSVLTMNNVPSTQYINGKIGQCYNFDGSAWGQVSGVSVGKDCSICCWAKTGTTSATMLWGIQCTGSDYMNLYNSWRICLNVGDSEDNPFRDSSNNDIPQIHDDIWHHYVVVFKGDEKAKLYIDGVYRGTAVTYRNPTMSSQNFTIGTWNYSSHGYYWYGGINDVRIYDHSLSAKEIKELSKGLILHYDFNDPYIEETTNLINQSNPITYTVRCSTYGNGVKIDWTNPDNQGDTYFMFNTPNMIPGVQYALSFDCNGLLPDSDTTWAVSNTYAPAKLHNGRNVFIFTPTSSALQLFFDDWSRDTRIDNLVMTNFQLEQGDHATPFHASVSNMFNGRMDFSDTTKWSRSNINSSDPTIDSDGNMVLYGVGTEGNHQSYTVSLTGGWITLSPLTTYTLSVWVKHSSVNAGFNMYFYEWNDSSNVQTTSVRFLPSSSEVGVWVKRSITLTTNSSTTKMYTELNCYNSPDGDTIILRNNSISLESPNMIYDSSGYGYNGIQVGDIQMLHDTRSGEYSLFNNGLGMDNWYSEGKAFIRGDLKAGMTFDALTISFWANVKQTYGNHSGIISLSMQSEWPTDYTTGGLAQYDGQFRFNTANGDSAVAQNILFNEWHHYAFTWNGSTLAMYRDGEWVAGTDSGEGAINESRYVFLGLNGAGGMWRKSKIYWGDFKMFATALSAADVLAEYNRKASVDSNGNLFTGEVIEYETTNNLMEKINYNIENGTNFATWSYLAHCTEDTYNSNWPNKTDVGLSAYVQDNCQVTQTSEGIRIYSTANATSDSTWGGLALSPMVSSRCLIKGHHYRISWHVKGHSSRAMTDVYWTNNVGWGQYPDAEPTVHKYVLPPSNFNGEMDCFYDFTINDDVFKTTTSDVHSGFEPNTTYLAYAAFKIGFTYQETGELGTDIYITNVKMYDLTSGDVYNIDKNGVVNTTEAVSGRRNSARLHSDGVIDITGIEEI